MNAIFVTGAASGIGRATARLFGRRGFRVGLYDVDVEGAAKVAAEIGDSSCVHGRIDVTSAESWKAAIEDFVSRSGRIDVLFNCAGILRMGRFEDVSAEDCKKQLDVNVMGVILGIKAALVHLERSRGIVINMSSASAVYGQPELAAYSATKFAVRALTEALDIEFRPKGVRVSDIMPGYTDTPMVHTQKHSAKTLSRLGINLTADDVAEVVFKAAHGNQVHWIPQPNVALLDRVGGLLPELGRLVMDRLAR